MMRNWQGWLLSLALVSALAVVALDQWIRSADLPPLPVETARIVADRKGELLRAYPVADGRWRLPVALEQVDPTYLKMLLAYEDKRFRTHSGVDPLAMARAVFQALWNRRVVSGGSTLSMQVARLLEEGSTGSLSGKLRQMRLALALERHLGKDEILQLYLLLAPYGGNIEGVRAASLSWFGKEPSRLTPAEAALLVALPQAPEARRPDRNPEMARQARMQVLDRVAEAGTLPRDEAQAANSESLPHMRHDFPMLAPHLADRVLAASASQVVATTIDAGLQRRLEMLVRENRQMLDPRLSVALIVADHGSGEILAEIGSALYTDDASDGFVDMTRARRSPGSTLKPLIYGLAFEAGIAHPETLVDDRPMRFGTYAPQNFDRRFRGTLSIRNALQLSLNLPVVAVLDAVGPARLMSRLRRSGAAPELPPGGAPGLAIGLGGIGLSLLETTNIYAGIANGGVVAGLHETALDPPDRILLGENAAWQVADILAGTAPPAGAGLGLLAYKTGTSYGYRDAWAIGFDGQHVIGVWIGRADGTPMPGALGVDLAAPLLFDAYARLESRPATLPAPPPSAMTLAFQELPVHLQHFNSGGSEIGGTSLAIAFPPDGARLDLAGGDGEVLLRASDGQLPYSWMVNGRLLESGPGDHDVLWQAEGRGFVRISVIDALGQAARTTVFVE